MKPKQLIRRLLVVAAALAITPLTIASAYDNDENNDIVYTMSNAATGNQVLAFRQGYDGNLTPAGEFATGGAGTGGGLGNQGALATDGDFLLVVNPGSDDLSVLRKTSKGLKLVERIPSGGIRPVSVTVDRDLIYVLNAGSDNIAGFVMRNNGKLYPLTGSERGLSGDGVAAAQVQFSRDGRSLIVTEKASNKIVTFSLNYAGLPVARKVFDSPGQTPFGFALGRGRQVLISEAVGGAPNASSVSSFRIDRDANLAVLDASVPTLQSAACWVAVTPDTRFAYVTNTASGTVSGYRILPGGQLQLLNSNGITATTGPGSGPIDLSFSDGGEYLHVLNSGTGSIATFAVSRRGGLTAVGSFNGLPAGSNGLVAF